MVTQREILLTVVKRIAEHNSFNACASKSPIRCGIINYLRNMIISLQVAKSTWCVVSLHQMSKVAFSRIRERTFHTVCATSDCSLVPVRLCVWLPSACSRLLSALLSPRLVFNSSQVSAKS